MCDFLLFLLIIKNINWSIIISIITAFAAIVGIILSFKSIKLTQKLEQEKNRPYMVIYKKILFDPNELDKEKDKGKIIIKNTGNTFANIIKITTSFKEGNDINSIDVILNNLKLDNTIFPPNHELEYEYNIYSNKSIICTFKVNYKDFLNRNFNEDFTIDLNKY